MPAIKRGPLRMAPDMQVSSRSVIIARGIHAEMAWMAANLRRVAKALVQSPCLLRCYASPAWSSPTPHARLFDCCKALRCRPWPPLQAVSTGPKKAAPFRSVSTSPAPGPLQNLPLHRVSDFEDLRSSFHQPSAALQAVFMFTTFLSSFHGWMT